ncbi:MAG TPA: formimidoylglutamate deiminase [Acidimicrobiales bacterium]|nr:formimidoylglutamate deiminase [Acidimicrobiales bacterium]
MTSWWAEWAWMGGPDEGAVAGVVLSEDGGVLTEVSTGVAAPAAGATVLRGITLPGLVNGHSHAFHRALRGGAAGEDFWSWREAMYAVAGALQPDLLLALARACFAEMVLAGITAVHEFHYLHQPGGMDDAVVEAAASAGIRLVLLDTCYLRAGFDGGGLSPVQRRFSDGDADRWAERASAVADRYPSVEVGAAIHSVRAVDPPSMESVARWAGGRRVPLHLHLSEQPGENEACLAATGRTPAELCESSGVLGPGTTAVHATHASASDIALLGRSGTAVCLCPTTERDLGDGVVPAAALDAAGCSLRLGSDSQAVVDLFEEARAVELGQRLVTGRRSHHCPAALLAAATGGRRLEIGAPADLTTVSVRSPRLAGFDPSTAAAHLVFAAAAADVETVVVGGRAVVSDGAHCDIDVGGELAAAITAVRRAAAG